jgi:predicted Zn-dependent protease
MMEAEFESNLGEWRANSYHDDDRPEIPLPQPLPTVQTADPAVEALVQEDPGPLIETVRRARSYLDPVGSERFDLEASAARSWRFLANSRGLQMSYPETSAGFGVSQDELYSRGFGKRRLMREGEFTQLLEDVISTTRALERQVPAPAGEVPVLLAPGLAMSLVGRFVVGNLAGHLVANGRSAFTVDDFRERRQVLRDDLSISIDTTLDLEGAASPISSEGVPGGTARLVDRGRLARPVVGLKYAARTGFPPTPAPRGSPGFLLTSVRSELELMRARFGIVVGLAVHEVLGLHTQDATSSRFSVVSNNAMVLGDGQQLGRTKVALSGDLQALLRDPRTILVRYPWGVNPGLLLWLQVEPRE